MSLIIFISCVFKTTVHRYNISYKKEQFKLYRSLLGVKGGVAKTAVSPTLSGFGKNQYFRPNFSSKCDKLK